MLCRRGLRRGFGWSFRDGCILSRRMLLWDNGGRRLMKRLVGLMGELGRRFLGSGRISRLKRYRRRIRNHSKGKVRRQGGWMQGIGVHRKTKVLRKGG